MHIAFLIKDISDDRRIELFAHERKHLIFILPHNNLQYISCYTHYKHSVLSLAKYQVWQERDNSGKASQNEH